MKEFLFYIVILLSNIIQCITGFAGTVLAMPFSVILVGYETAKPILNILGLLASIIIAVKGRKHINYKEAVRVIAVMLLGMGIGSIIKNSFNFEGEVLYKILGLVVIAFALFNGYRFLKKKEDRHFSVIISSVLLITSGIVHGLFVCGGPLLVTYLGGKIKNKDEFRSSVSAVWIVLNSIILLEDICSGIMNSSLITTLAISAVMLILAYVIGNLIYEKMSKNLFLLLTYILMFISGVSLLIK